MLQFQNSSHQAFEELFQRCRRPLHGLFARRLRDAARAEELTQEVFMAVIKGSFGTSLARRCVRISTASVPIRRFSHGRELNKVLAEIKTAEAEQKQLKNQIALATMTLVVKEDYKPPLRGNAYSIPVQIRNAAVNGFTTAAQGIISAVF